MVRELAPHGDGLAAHRRLRRRPRVPGRRRGDHRRPRRARRAAAARTPRPRRRPSSPGSRTRPWPSSRSPSAPRTSSRTGPAQQRSGYLVPAVDGRAVKAATFSTVKWPHLARQAPVHIVRCSIGRSGDVAVLQRDDAGPRRPRRRRTRRRARRSPRSPSRGASPAGAAACRSTTSATWTASPASAASVAEQPGLAVAGAAYDGIGIPACIATARSAVVQVTGYLAATRPAPRRSAP